MEKKPIGKKLLLNFMRSLLAALYMLLVLYLVTLFDSAFFAACIGASAFTAFTFPNAVSARPRYIMGGYLCGAVCGVVCCIGRMYGADTRAVTLLYCALAVFLTAFSMDLLDLEHPSAIAFALSLVLTKYPLQMAGISLGCIVLLCVMKQALLLIANRKKETPGE